MIPLILRLKKESHKEIAKAQDLIVKELYKVFNDAVLHGGTAIWRCYNGNRFSEDVDVYIKKDEKKLNILFDNLKRNGFFIEKKKISENSLYSNLKFNGTFVKLEALFKRTKGILGNYEESDGNITTVYTLIPEGLINEKINTYLKRLKIRDLYDIFFLLKYVKNENQIEKKIKELIKNFKNPIDEKELKILLLEGIVPSTDEMLNYIQRGIKN